MYGRRKERRSGRRRRNEEVKKDAMNLPSVSRDTEVQCSAVQCSRA